MLTHSPPTAGDQSPAAHPRIPLLVYAREPLAHRAMDALGADHRVEVFAPQELTAEWVQFGRRAAACVVATVKDPFGALAYAAMAGLDRRVVMAIHRRHAHECSDLLRAGAFACITMPLDPVDVTQLVTSLTPHPDTPHVHNALRLIVDPVTRTIRHGVRVARLTQRELALLHTLMSREGRPVSAEQLLATAWVDNPSATGSRPLLEVYVHQLRKKLEHVGLKGVLTTVRGYGYALLPQQPA